MDAYKNTANINQKECWLAAKEYSIEKMVNSILQALEEIKQEWKY
jgi:hypothetical protein